MREDEIKDLIRDLRVKQEEEEPQDADQTKEEPQDQIVDPVDAEQENDSDKKVELEDLVDRLEKVLDRLDRILGDDSQEDDQPEEVIEYRELPRRINSKESYSRSRHYRRTNR